MKILKKLFTGILVAGCVLSMAGCQNSQPASGSNANGAANKTIDKMTIAFVPSRDPEEIVTLTAPLKGLLTSELAGMGYDVKNIDITVGTTYEAVGEGLDAGSVDIGFGMPGGTYVLYSDACDVILTSTRNGLSKDFDTAVEWNDGKPTDVTEKQAVSYRSMLIAGPSEKGKALADKVNAKKELTWDDLNSVSWSIMNTSSSAGYVYPALWLEETYGKSLPDLSSTVISDSYASAFARLASGQVDVLVTYADARRDYAEKWTGEYGRTAPIWAETNVVGVTAPIYNDTITVSKNSDMMDSDLIAALQKAFINIASTEEGKKVISIYSHNGYQAASDADYDSERAAQKLLQELSGKQ